MPALDLSGTHYSALMKRGASWPSHNRGVMVVFCIIGTLILVVLALIIHRKLSARKTRRENEAFQAGTNQTAE